MTFPLEPILNYLDRLSFGLTKKKVVVLDNASIHRNRKVKELIKIWEKRGLFQFYLPLYSPWRMIADIVLSEHIIYVTIPTNFTALGKKATRTDMSLVEFLYLCFKICAFLLRTCVGCKRIRTTCQVVNHAIYD